MSRGDGRSASQPRVSVVIAVHDGERFIGPAVESVLAQSLKDLELIVVDDASTDGTLAVLAGFDDARLVVLRSPGRGISAALNHGIARSRAPLIARLDADDLMEPHRLERQVAFLSERPELGGAASHYWIIDEAGETRGFHDPGPSSVDEIEIQLMHGGRLTYPHPTTLLRREAVEAAGGYDPRYDKAEDVDLFLRMYEAGGPMIVQPERLTRFRIHASSVSAVHARTQHFLNEAVFGNYRRRRAGLPDLPVEHYAAEARRAPWRWLATEGAIASHRLRRASLIARMQRRRAAAMLLLAGAALADPPAGFGALLRRMRRAQRLHR